MNIFYVSPEKQRHVRNCGELWMTNNTNLVVGTTVIPISSIQLELHIGGGNSEESLAELAPLEIIKIVDQSRLSVAADITLQFYEEHMKVLYIDISLFISIF